MDIPIFEIKLLKADFYFDLWDFLTIACFYIAFKE
jgi:hypothetical protein